MSDNWPEPLTEESGIVNRLLIENTRLLERLGALEDDADQWKRRYVELALRLEGALGVKLDPRLRDDD